MISKNELWATALQTLLGYSAHAPVHTTASYSQAPSNILEAMRDAGDARDIIHAIVASAANDMAPASISMLIRRGGHDLWVQNCRLYAASHWSPLELLADDQRWIVGRGDVLVPAKLPQAGRRAKGEDIAMNRLQRAVEKMATRAIPDLAVERDRALLNHAAPDDFDVAA